MLYHVESLDMIWPHPSWFSDGTIGDQGVEPPINETRATWIWNEDLNAGIQLLEGIKLLLTRIFICSFNHEKHFRRSN